MKRSTRYIMAPFLLIFFGIFLITLPAIPSPATEEKEKAPGRTMARQATQKNMEGWTTTDHAKHKALQKDFNSGMEVTQACLSCHSEAEAQFHETIHWTWLVAPEDKDRQYGKSGLSLNNFCISTNKSADKSCLACHL